MDNLSDGEWAEWQVFLARKIAAVFAVPMSLLGVSDVRTVEGFLSEKTLEIAGQKDRKEKEENGE